jgi:diguanylate cyclase (GGDEF)-like protein
LNKKESGMSLIKQVWVLVMATLLLAFAVALCVSIATLRSYSETQLRFKNNDNAQSLALTLSQLRGDKVSMALAIAAQFDTGHYASIRLVGLDGQLWLPPRQAQRSGSGVSSSQLGAPQWFVRLVPIRAEEGIAQVTDGWYGLGTLYVSTQLGTLYRDLWRITVGLASFLAILGAVAGFFATVAVRSIQRPLAETVAQAQALAQRKFVTAPLSKTPELRQLGQAMNLMVAQIGAMFEEQTLLAEQLRRDATCDPLTGWSHRRHFLSQLHSLLEVDADLAPPSESLLLIRVLDLGALNKALGYVQTDALLRKLASMLSMHVSASQRLGRLNGSDFAVCVQTTPQESLSECLATLMDDIRGVLLTLSSPIELPASIGVCGAAADLAGYTSVSALLIDVDAALARAESRGVFAFEVVPTQTPSTSAHLPSWGADVWRSRLLEALQSQQAQLMEYPLVDVRGGLIHFECPLRLPLVPGEEAAQALLPASVWLPFALRCGLIPKVDLTAARLALSEIDCDGIARGVNVSPASLQDSSFLEGLREALAEYPNSAGLLWLEVGENVVVAHKKSIRTLCEQMRPFGVKVGLEHAGPQLAAIEGLLTLGLSFIKLDASVTQGVAADEHQQKYVSHVVKLLRGVGLNVFAEGVTNEADAKALWIAGLDGMTGPGVARFEQFV